MKNRKSHQRNRRYKETSNVNFRIENQPKQKSRWIGSTAEWRRQERISELEGRTIEIPQCEQREKNFKK